MSNREFKHLSFTNIKAQSKGRIRSGVCAVFGNVDSWGDRIAPGAFAKTIAEGKGRVRHLWNHDNSQPPIASIKELRELSREELPKEVLEKAPDATGGLLVTREYYEGNPLSEWILKAIDAGDINEMSFAFDVVQWKETVEDTGLEDMPKRHIRELLEMKLFDTSDVNWGMNGATVAIGAKNAGAMPLGAIAAQFSVYAKDQKSGQRNSGADQTLIDLIHNTAISLGAKCAAAEDEPKSEKAEAVIDTSLSSDWFELQKLSIQILEI